MGLNRMAVIEQLRAVGVECFTREEWGSARPSAYIKRRSTHPMPDGPADYHFLHITVTADTDTVKEGKAGAKQIEGYGYSTPKMVSYQDLVTNEARYFQGQDYGTKGTHTINDKNVKGFPKDLNLKGYALALMQNVEDEVTDDQIELIAMVFAARELAGLVKRYAPIYPHRKFAYKGCPGDKAVAVLAEIEKRKNAFVKRGTLKKGAPVVRNREEAAKLAENTNFNKPGTCQLWTRTIFDAPSVGDVDGDKDADAVDGWKSEPRNKQHPGDQNPPRGVPVAFSGGSKGYGHRAISLGKGKIRSTDMASNGRYKAGSVATVTIEQIEKAMGVKYTGWSETISRIQIPVPTKPKTSRGPRVDHAIQDLKIARGTGERKRLMDEARVLLEKIPPTR